MVIFCDIKDDLWVNERDLELHGKEKLFNRKQTISETKQAIISAKNEKAISGKIDFLSDEVFKNYVSACVLLY